LLETIFKKPRYIVFPNMLLSTPPELRGFSDKRRSLCLVYDEELDRLVGAVYGFDIALGVSLRELYTENTYGSTVPTEWFWDKWGGNGVGVIRTRPTHVYRLPKPLSAADVMEILLRLSPNSAPDLDKLLEEASIGGFAIQGFGLIRSFSKSLWATQGIANTLGSSLPQLWEAVELVKEVGRELSYDVRVEKTSSGGFPSITAKVLWASRRPGDLHKLFFICPARLFLSLLGSNVSRSARRMLPAFVVYDVERGAKVLEILSKNALERQRDRYKERCRWPILGWRDLLELYQVIASHRNLLNNLL